MRCSYYRSQLVLIARADSLFEHDLGGSFAVHAEAAIRQFGDSAHGLPDGVEGVHFVKLLLWDLVSNWLVIPLQVQDQSQQTALRLVSHLLWQTAFLIWGLQRGGGKFYLLYSLIFGGIHIHWHFLPIAVLSLEFLS